MRATKPGGVVAVEDVDHSGGFSYPPNAAYSALFDLYSRAAYARGCDPNVGQRLGGMFLAAGLTDVDVHVEQPAGFDVDVKLLSPLTLEAVADSVVALGFISRNEIDGLIEELYRVASDHSTILSLPRIFQVSGRVPSKAQPASPPDNTD